MTTQASLTEKPGAGSFARWDLFRGRGVTGVPTATTMGIGVLMSLEVTD